MTKRTKPPKASKLLVALDPEDRRLLERTARAEKLPLAEVVRRAIREYSTTAAAR